MVMRKVNGCYSFLYRNTFLSSEIGWLEEDMIHELVGGKQDQLGSKIAQIRSFPCLLCANENANEVLTVQK